MFRGLLPPLIQRTANRSIMLVCFLIKVKHFCLRAVGDLGLSLTLRLGSFSLMTFWFLIS